LYFWSKKVRDGEVFSVEKQLHTNPKKVDYNEATINCMKFGGPTLRSNKPQKMKSQEKVSAKNSNCHPPL
jgi:hypothetical protein